MTASSSNQKTMASSSKTINIIPMEILLLILLNLPIKLLCQLKCVCKSWYAIIESQDFFKLHIIPSLKLTTSYNGSLILAVNRNDVVDRKPCMVTTFYRAYLSLNETKHGISKLALPSSFQHKSVIRRRMPFSSCEETLKSGPNEVVSSCNGLVLILIGTNKQHFVVCNPIFEDENAYEMLPCLNYPGSCFNSDPCLFFLSYKLNFDDLPYERIIWRTYDYRIFGLGYDCVSRLYKFVYLSKDWPLIYTLGKDRHSWRKINIPNHIRNVELKPNIRVTIRACGPGVMTNNHLHWNITEYDHLDFEYSREAILSFDLCNEDWDEVPIPDELVKGYFLKGCAIKPYIIDVGLLDECLCLLISRGISYPNLDLWIMKEYGVKESWTRLGKLPYRSGIPLYYRKDRDEVLLPGEHHGLGWFNLRDNKLRKVEFHGDGFKSKPYKSTKLRMCVENYAHPFSSID